MGAHFIDYQAEELSQPYEITLQSSSEDRGDILLATVSDRPTTLLFSQHVFTAFI